MMKKLNFSINTWLLAVLPFLFAGFFTWKYFNQELEITSPTFQNLPLKEASVSDRKFLTKYKNRIWTYLNKGGQSYVFESPDGKYVLKLFKFKHFRPNFLESFLFPLPLFENLKQQILKKKNDRFYSLVDGYRMAFERHRKETALVLTHLDPTDNLDIVFHFIGPSGGWHSLNLDDMPFIVQKKGEGLKALVGPLLTEGKQDEALSLLNRILELYYTEYQKGLYDRDHGVTRNLGFVDGEPFHLDVGKLSYNPDMCRPEIFEKDLLKVKERITPWLSQKHPEFLLEFTNFFDTKKNELCKRASQT